MSQVLDQYQTNFSSSIYATNSIAFGYSVCNSNSCSTAKVEVQVGSTSISQSGSGPQQNLLMAITNEVTHLNVLDYPISLSGELKVQKATKPQHGTLMVLSGKQEMIYSPEKDYVGEDGKFAVAL